MHGRLGIHRLEYLAAMVRDVGPAFTARALRRQLASTTTYLGLRCDLSRIPPVPPAQVEVRMERRACAGFTGFEDERRVATGADAYEVLLRLWSCLAGVESLYVAESDGRPVYCQWLVRPEEQPALDRHSPGSYAPLRPGEVLLEGAYTFTAFRGRRAMAAGMVQLLHLARSEGAEAAITYVTPDNVPSLRGCARVGFELDHQRVNRLRLGRRVAVQGDPDVAALAAWKAATA